MLIDRPFIREGADQTERINLDNLVLQQQARTGLNPVILRTAIR